MNTDPDISYAKSIDDRNSASLSSSYPRRLTLSYIIALGLVAILTLCGQVAVQLALRNLEGDSRIVNIAGRQRMLSQRIVRLILELENPDVSVDRQSAALLELKNLSQDWTNRQDALQYGSLQLQIQAKNTPTIIQLFEQIEPDFRAINVLVDQFLSDASKLPSAKYLLVEKRQELLSRSESFLFGMESIVSHYEVESRQRVERLRSTEAWLVIATLVVLLCEGCFIFSPAVRSLRNSFRRIRAVTEQLQLAKMRGVGKSCKNAVTHSR